MDDLTVKCYYYSMKRKFIVFEGIDGSGTSTLAVMLQDLFIRHNLKSVLTSEPTIGPIGSMIRQILFERVFVSKEQKKREQVLAHLFAADRTDHLYNDKDGIIQHLENGAHVICTRYTLSSYAYHSFSDDFQKTHDLNKNFPEPDILFYLDCPVECAMERISKTRIADINENRENLERVKENYEAAIKKYDIKCIRLNAANTPEQVFSEVVKHVSTQVD